MSIDVETIESITSKIPIIEKVVYVFIQDWRDEKLKPDEKINDEISKLLEDNEWIKVK